MKGLLGPAGSPRRSAGVRRARPHSKVLWTVTLAGFLLAVHAGTQASPAAARPATSGEGRRPVGSDVETDWPGCGGVCGVRVQPDYLILDMRSAPAPGSALRLTLTVFLEVDTTGSGSRAFDVTSAFGAGQSGIVAVDGADIPGGTANAASAVLTWVDPATGRTGRETIPLL